MTVLVDLSPRSFAPQTLETTLAFEADATLVRITFVRGDWPDGPVLQYTPIWGGVPASTTQMGGSVLRDKDGNPTGGTIATTINVAKPPGLTSGTVRVIVLQTFDSSVLVESF